MKIQISEFGTISTKEKESKYLSCTVSEEVFEEIVDVAIEFSDLFTFVDRNTIKAKNYVGTIRTKSGITIEIYPKTTQNDNTNKAKVLLIKLLALLFDLPSYKTANLQHLDTNSDLLEVFIALFVNEVRSIIQKGLKSDYLSIEKNSPYLKGKLLISHHIKHNFAHQERFYIQHDLYHVDRLENRLLKSALLFLRSQSKEFTNIRRIQEALLHFGQVNPSSDPKNDFNKLNLKRDMRHYTMALEWARLFLEHKSSNIYSGSDKFIAILFPMEKLFERFVEYHYKQLGFAIKRQVGKVFIHGLVTSYADIIATKEEKKLLIDVKWKIIQSKKEIQNSDIYQLFSYSKLFDINDLVLCYPQFGEMQNMEFQYFNDTKLKINFLDIYELLKN